MVDVADEAVDEGGGGGMAAIVSIVSAGAVVASLLLLLPELGPIIVTKLFGVGGNCIFIV